MIEWFGSHSSQIIFIAGEECSLTNSPETIAIFHLLVTMTNGYLSRLKRLCFTYRRRFSFVPLPHSKLHLSPFSSLPTTTDPNLNSSTREQALHSLLKHCCTLKDLEQIHSLIIQTGFSQSLFVVGKIISFCAVSDHGLMDYAVSVFEQIQNPDGFLWNTMIRGFGRSNKPAEAFGFYKKMRDKGEMVDNFTYSFMLKICADLGAVEIGKQFHCGTVKHGLDSHVFVRNTLIYMYGTFRDTATSLYLFEEIPEPDLVAWNTIIDCYVSSGKSKEAVDLFLRMQRHGVEADEATLVVILSACSDLGALDLGRWAHSRIDYMGINQVVSVSNSLIDMYAKCGEIEEARLVFHEMKKKNIVSWNSMILGLAMHGYADEALDFFSRMQRLKLETPNDITFLGVLCACSHRGLVNEGRKYFESMIRDYKIEPTIKHYGCMVDLFGRAGFVEEAYQVIQSMPMECNAIVWRALLGACRVHGKLELGEQVRRHLEKLEPDHSGDFVLLSNMYASEGRWNDMFRVRKAMRGRGVQKPNPGNSLIDTNPSV